MMTSFFTPRRAMSSPIPVHRFSAFHDPRTSLPVTERYGERTLTLPLFGHMTAAQQRLVVESVVAALAPS